MHSKALFKVQTPFSLLMFNNNHFMSNNPAQRMNNSGLSQVPFRPEWMPAWRS
jgi:hypothetical protein